MNRFFPEVKSSGGRVKVEVDLSNYGTKADLVQNATGVDTSVFAKKADLANLKSDVDKFKNVPSGLNSLKDLLKRSSC